MNPQLTIIIPSYNSLKDLPYCIESIENTLSVQMGDSVVIHVQDGKSSDGTEKYLRTLDLPYLTYHSAKDLGVYDAMNRAVKISRTKWIYFMGADDRLLPGFTEALEHLKENDRIYYGNVVIASTGERYDGRFTPLKLVYRNICHQSMFFPSHLLKATPYSLRYRIKSDWASNIEFIRREILEYFEYDIAVFQDQNGLSSTQDDIVFEQDKARLFRVNHGVALQLQAMLAPFVTSLYKRANHLMRNETKSKLKTDIK